MRTLDFSPLLRATVGFDRMMNMLDTASRVEDGAPSYPPYNIEKTGEDAYRITMAVAGFHREELEITSEQNTLVIAGKHGEKGDRQYLYKGIAERNFERKFQLAEHVKVVDARRENGLLHVELVREIPEAMKPRKIAIGDGGRVIDQDAA